MSPRRAALLAAGLCAALLLTAAPAVAAKDKTPPTTPTNLHITATTSTSVSLAWNTSTDNSKNFWYCVQTNGSGCIRVDPPKTTLTRTKLWPDSVLAFSVYAVDAAGNRSKNSNTVTFTTPPDTTPPSPAPNLTVAAVFPTRASLTWAEPVDNVSQVWTTLRVDGTALFVDRLGPPSYTLVGLTPATTYLVQVSARDAFGNTVVGDALAVTTPGATDTQPPTVPANLRIQSQSASPDIALRWDQSTDDVDPPSLIRYEIFFGSAFDHGVTGVGNTWTSCPFEGSGPVTIAVRAVDTSGNASVLSNTVVFNC